MRCLLDDIWGVTTRLDTNLPQVLLGSLEQGTPLDVWAAGVVVMSLLARRYPLFLAAQDRSDEPALLQVRPQLRGPNHTGWSQVKNCDALNTHSIFSNTHNMQRHFVWRRFWPHY